MRLSGQVLWVTLLTIPPLLEHLVDGLSEEERNLRPPPPQRTEQNLENRKGKEHVRRVQKMPDKENDCRDGADRKYKTRDER